ncbi:MAG: hypothetical protein JWN17_1190 [Frankiales bacterium]|nr:hypothetical protein [Frankiales bacterium]
MPVADVVLDLPPGWSRADRPAPGVLLLGLEPGAGQPFRANLVVTADDLGPLDLRGWQLQTDAALPRALEGYALLDLEHVQVDGRPGVRRLASHVVRGRAVVLEQWAVVSGPLGWTLSATVPALAWPSAETGLADVVAGWHVP